MKKHLPDSLIVGPMKAGTSWIHDYLATQGNVCLPNGVKETHYFDTRYSKGIDWYSSHFDHYESSRHNRTIEVGPSYFHCADAPARIRSDLGKIPLVFTLRDPVKRSWSHYLHLLRYGYTNEPIQRAVRKFSEVIEASCYSRQLEHWEGFFEAENIHVLWQESLAENPVLCMELLSEFLDLQFLSPPDPEMKKSNEAAVPPSQKLASIGRKLSHRLRDQKIYGVVNFAKKLGLKKVFFGTPGKARLPEMSGSDRDWLMSKVMPDYEMLPERYKRECSRIITKGETI